MLRMWTVWADIRIKLRVFGAWRLPVICDSRPARTLNSEVVVGWRPDSGTNHCYLTQQKTFTLVPSLLCCCFKTEGHRSGSLIPKYHPAHQNSPETCWCWDIAHFSQQNNKKMCIRPSQHSSRPCSGSMSLVCMCCSSPPTSILQVCSISLKVSSSAFFNMRSTEIKIHLCDFI